MIIKEKVDTSYVETFCNKNGWGKINLEDLLNSFIEHYKETQALQLQQAGVSGRSEQLCGNLDENYNCKNMCLTRCVDGKKFYK